MTPEELLEIDRKVAEAIRLEYGMSGRHILRDREWNGRVKVPFQPSTDMNDAMFAAEKSGIEDMRITQTTGGYELVVFNEWGESRFHAGAETTPLAICQAILKLTNVGNS